VDIQSLEKMITAGRDSALLRLTLARLYVKEQQWHKAEDHLRLALTLEPDYTAAWKELGQVHRAIGQNQSALAAFRKGIEVARTHGDKQAEKEMAVFVKRLLRAEGGK